MAPEDREAPAFKAGCQSAFRAEGLFPCGNRVPGLVQARSQSNAVLLDAARGLVATSVLVEPLFGGMRGLADVHTWLVRASARSGIVAQFDHVHGVDGFHAGIIGWDRPPLEPAATVGAVALLGGTAGGRPGCGIHARPAGPPPPQVVVRAMPAAGTSRCSRGSRATPSLAR